MTDLEIEDDGGDGVAVMTGTPAPAPKKSGNSISIPECLCGCRNENGSKEKKGKSSRFLPGHDARIRRDISRVSQNKAAPGFRFPSVVIDFARANPGAMVVKPYDAEFLLEQVARLERGEGTR